MIQHRLAVSGEPVEINVVENEEDLEQFTEFIRSNRGLLGLDSETTGLDIYNDGYRCRLVQFGTDREAWVVPVELGPRYVQQVRWALDTVEKFVLHNASFDLQVFERCFDYPMVDLWPRVTDTQILSHLVDPRGKKEGGVGHSLEELTRRYIDADIADNVKTLMADLAAAHKTTKANVWKKVPLTDPHYQIYSGMDPILAFRLYTKVGPLIPTTSTKLIRYEHRVAEICTRMEQTGFLLDVGYTRQLSDELRLQENLAKETIQKFGDISPNSTEQVAEVLETLGVKILGRTTTGKRQVNDELLSEVAKGDGEAAQFAAAVIEAKKAGKWRRTWVDKFLATKDGQNRCHASINPLQARTGRMSITGIPAQTLPAGDWMIRRCFLADPGQLIASVDYQAQELRVLAALSGDQTMIQAFKNGDDLHLLTARAAFGDQITKDSPERKYAKVVNFGRVYGGGANTVAKQTGLDFRTAKRVVDGFDQAYPGVQKFSAKLQREATQQGYVTTPTGRRLPVDEDRAYSALNYVIQSTSRDVTCAALIRLDEAGFTPYLRLPIHDEILASVPADKAEWGAREIGKIMAQQMGPVHIGTDPEVGGRSWGSLYGAET